MCTRVGAATYLLPPEEEPKEWTLCESVLLVEATSSREPTFSPGNVVMTPRGVEVHQNPSHAGSSNMFGITFVKSRTVLITAQCRAQSETTEQCIAGDHMTYPELAQVCTGASTELLPGV